MSGFTFFSDEEDTDHETAISELISEAKDLSVLEQISAINCSAFTDLPSDLDTRFQKLKSFPISKPPSKNKQLSKQISDLGPKSVSGSVTASSKLDSFHDSDLDTRFRKLKSFPEKHDSDMDHHPDSGREIGSVTIPSKLNSFPRNPISTKDSDSDGEDSENGIFSPSKQTPKNEKTKKKRGLGPKSVPGSITSPSNCSTESVVLSGSEQKKNVRKSKSGQFYSSSSSQSPSPPAKSGCFLCSPKRVLKKKSNYKTGNHEMGFSDDEILADLSIFSGMERNRILKKAMEEEEKVNREADKIVKWAKQASARMNVHSYEDDEDDDHIFK